MAINSIGKPYHHQPSSSSAPSPTPSSSSNPPTSLRALDRFKRNRAPTANNRIDSETASHLGLMFNQSPATNNRSAATNNILTLNPATNTTSPNNHPSPHPHPHQPLIIDNPPSFQQLQQQHHHHRSHQSSSNFHLANRLPKIQTNFSPSVDHQPDDRIQSPSRSRPSNVSSSQQSLMNSPAIATTSSSNSPSTSGSWTVSGKSVRKKASGLLREAARSWGRSRSKEVLSFGLGVLIGSPQQQQNNQTQQQHPHQPESGPSSPRSTLNSRNRHHRQQDQSPLGIILNSTTPPPNVSQPQSHITITTPARPGLSSNPTSAGTIVKGPKKRISFHGAPKLKLKDKQASKLKRRSEIGFGDWADTLNTAVATSSPSSPPPPMLQLISHPGPSKDLPQPIDRSIACKDSAQSLTPLGQTTSLSNPNPLEVEAMNFSCRKNGRNATHIKHLMASIAKDSESNPPALARVPRSNFPHPHRSPRSPRRTYHTRATANRNQPVSNQRQPERALVGTPATPLPDPASTSLANYQQPPPLTSSPFKRSVSPINQFEDGFDVESPIASKSLGRIPRISGSESSDNFRRSVLVHSVTQSPIKPKPAANSDIARLKEVSSARANLFGATPNQSGGLEPFVIPRQPLSADSTSRQMYKFSPRETATLRENQSIPTLPSISSLGLSVPGSVNDSFTADHLQAQTTANNHLQAATANPHSRQRSFSATLQKGPPHAGSLQNRESDHPFRLSLAPQDEISGSEADGCLTSTSSARRMTGLGAVRGCSSLTRREGPSSSSSLNSRLFSPSSSSFPSSRRPTRSGKERAESLHEPGLSFPGNSNSNSRPRFEGDDMKGFVIGEPGSSAGSSKPGSCASLSQASSSDLPPHSLSGGSTSSISSVSSSATTLGFDGFGALPPPESPFRPLHQRPVISSRISQVSASPNKLKRDLDGQLVGSSQRASLLHPSSSIQCLLSKSQQVADVSSQLPHRDYWGHRSLDNSEDDDDDNGFIVHGDHEPNHGSHESHEGLSNLSVPGLTDSSSLASSLASSNQSAGLVNPSHFPPVDCSSLEPGASWDESGREAKRRSLPTHVGRTTATMTPSQPALAQIPPLPTRPITSTPPTRHPVNQLPSLRNFVNRLDDQSDQTGEASFQSVKPNASAFISTGLVSKSVAAREKRENSYGQPSPFLKYVLTNANESSVSGIACDNSSSSIEESIAIRSMREALGGARVIAEAVKEDEAIQQRLQLQYEKSLSFHSAQNSFGLSACSPGVLPPDLCARRPSLSSLRMPDTPIKKPNFLQKAASAYLKPQTSSHPHPSSSHQSLIHTSRPFVSSGLSKQAPLFASSPIEGSPIENSPSCRSYRIRVPDSPLPRMPQLKSHIGSGNPHANSPDQSRWVLSPGDESGGSPSLPLVPNGTLPNHGSPSPANNGCDLLARQSPLFRRRSSDAVLCPKGKISSAVDPKNSSHRQGNLFGDPSTPTKVAPGWLKRAPQLLTSPGNSISSVASSPNGSIVPYHLKQSQQASDSSTELLDPQVTPHRTKNRLYTSFTGSALAAAEARSGSRSIHPTDPESSISPPPQLRRPALHSRHSSTSPEEIRLHQLVGSSSEIPLAHHQRNRFENEFDCVELIGVGEFGEVFKARHASTAKVYAVKRGKKTVTGPRSRTRQYEEVEVLKRLTQREDASPYIIQLIDAWHDLGTLNIQAEYCANGTLEKFLEMYTGLQERLDEVRTWKIMGELVQAVAFMHSEGIQHFDIKPANVFIDSFGGLKVGDFGLAKRWPRINPKDAEECGTYEGKYRLYRHAPEGPLTPESEDRNSIVPERFLRYEDVSDKEERKMMRFKDQCGRFVGFDLEREGDREYIAPEVLAGRYGEEADVYSIGLIVLEISTNVVLPDNGDEWTGLRTSDFNAINFTEVSSEMVFLVKRMLDSCPDRRITIEQLACHPVIVRLNDLRKAGLSIEKQELMGRDGLGDIEMKSNDPMASSSFFPTEERDGYEEVVLLPPKDNLWTRSRGAVLPEAAGFLDFIMTGFDSTPKKKGTKSFVSGTDRSSSDGESIFSISSSSSDHSGDSSGSKTKGLEYRMMMDVDQ